MEKITIVRPFKGLTTKTGTNILRNSARYYEIDFSEVEKVWDNFGYEDSPEKLNTYDFSQLVDMVRSHSGIKMMSELVRKEKNKDRRNFLKSTRLPSVFFGEFRLTPDAGGRMKVIGSGLVKHSEIICIDIDKLEPHEMWAVSNIIDSDPYTLMRWLSASGNGYKVLMKTDAGIQAGTHEDYYRAAIAYWRRVLPLEVVVDAACKDPNRRCFLSHDPEPYVNEDSQVWSERIEVKKYEPVKSSVIFDEDIYATVAEAVERVKSGKRGNKNNSRFVDGFDYIDGQRHNFLIHLAAICKGWGMSEGDFRIAASEYISGTSDGDRHVRTQYARKDE